MQATKRLTLALLLVAGAGFAAPVLAADAFQLAANQTLTGRPDLDSNPGPGDTDINNDGRDDLEQIKEGAKSVGAKIDPYARDFGNRAEVQLDRAGDKAKTEINQLGQNLKQVDLNDADRVMGPNWTVWLIVGLVALAVIAMLFAASNRRRRVIVRRY